MCVYIYSIHSPGNSIYIILRYIYCSVSNIYNYKCAKKLPVAVLVLIAPTYCRVHWRHLLVYTYPSVNPPSPSSPLPPPPPTFANSQPTPPPIYYSRNTLQAYLCYWSCSSTYRLGQLGLPRYPTNVQGGGVVCSLLLDQSRILRSPKDL